MTDVQLQSMPETIRKHIPEMVALAKQTRKNAQHAKRHVGAAVLSITKDGHPHIYKGANWKLIPGDTPHRYCAERVAALAALSDGTFEDIVAVVVVANMRHDRDYDGLVRMCAECVEFFEAGFKHPHTVWIVTIDADTDQSRVMTFKELIETEKYPPRNADE
jgi:cytidine deaminase